ncbi:hypothetical protein MRX96_052272 [Rhipicephalus microplus]
MESEVEKRENISVVFVNRHDLDAFVAFLDGAVLGCSNALAHSFRSFAMLIRNAEEGIASRTDSENLLGGGNPCTDHPKRSYAHTDAMVALFLGIWREQEFDWTSSRLHLLIFGEYESCTSAPSRTRFQIFGEDKSLTWMPTRFRFLVVCEDATLILVKRCSQFEGTFLPFSSWFTCVSTFCGETYHSYC